MARVRSFDGMRAFAMLAVVARHTNLPLGWGGWLGVDVFFVLSGYLITSLLLAEREKTGRIVIARFYALRAARLYPALIVLVLAGSAWASQLGDHQHGYSLTALLALTYTEDLWIWANGNFGGSLSQVWSLAVEEQFYLLWPLVITIFKTRKSLVLVTILASAISFGLMVCSNGQVDGTTQSYFLPQTRAWELLLGGLLSTVMARVDVHRTQAVVLTWIGALGLTVIILLAGQIGSLRSGSMTAMECLATVSLSACLIVGLASGESAIRRLLELRPLQWLGRISYGVYLFHMPVTVLVSNWFHVRTPFIFLLVLAISVTLADSSFRWIESPIRQYARKRSYPATSRTIGVNSSQLAPLPE